MNKSVVRKLNFAKKLLLGTAGVAAIALPIVFGLARPAQSSAQSGAANAAALTAGYQHVSITAGATGSGPVEQRVWFSPDTLIVGNQTLQELIKLAYGVQQSQISGGPDWLATTRFNVEAKLDSSTVAELSKLSPQQQKMERDLMLQNLLADHFQLALHRESKLLPAYALVIAKDGPKVQPAKPGDTYPNGIKGEDGLPAGPHKFDFGPDGVIVQALPISFVTEHLALHLNQPVVDRTGLTGDYDFTLKINPGGTNHKEIHDGKEVSMHIAPLNPHMAALLNAVEEQLGLRLDPQTLPLPVLIIDRAVKPAAN